MIDSALRQSKRQDTKLESEGAEFLVLGNLLIQGILCYKAHVNYPGFDLIAVNPDTQKTARIQVKSRWASDYDKGFPIKNFDCEFVVHVALNRGYKVRKLMEISDNGVRSPNFYIFPVEIVKEYRSNDGWGKVFINKIPDIVQYQDNWDLIVNYLSI
jgi:hypothetical protein